MTIDDDIKTIREYEEWRATQVSLGRDFDIEAYEAYRRALGREGTLRAIHEVATYSGSTEKEFLAALNKIALLSAPTTEVVTT